MIGHDVLELSGFTVSRRAFLGGSAGFAFGIALGVAAPGAVREATAQGTAPGLNAYVAIRPDGTITLPLVGDLTADGHDDEFDAGGAHGVPERVADVQRAVPVVHDAHHDTGARPLREGPGDGPWQGIAVLDHPTNHGFPHEAGKYAGSMGENGPGTGQITLSYYPPETAPNGPFTFTWRTYVHRGDAIDGKEIGRAHV